MEGNIFAVLGPVRESCPEHLQPEIYAMEDLWERRLWHQLTGKLLAVFEDPASKPFRMTIFKKFVLSFKSHINQLKLVILGLSASRTSSSNEEAYNFLSDLLETVNQPTCQDAYVFALVETARVKMLLSDLETSRSKLDEAGKILDTFDTVETVIHAAYYQVNADYYKVQGDFTAYYRTTLLYLACIDLENLILSEQQSRAYDLSVAAVLGETVYNFGELLLHPVLESLKGTENDWLRTLLFAVNAGDMAGFDRMTSNFSKVPLFEQNIGFLRQKICLTALTEAVFRRPPHDRQLSFASVASETRLVSDEVEHLVMKALSLGLIRGHIDQVAETVKVSWVQPRVLDRNQIAGMQKRLIEWNENVKKLEVWVESEGREVWAK